MKAKAIINVYNGGKYGRMGQYIAIIEPVFFKNGKMKKTGFRTIEVIEQIKKGYRATNNATQTESIGEIIEIYNDEPAQKIDYGKEMRQWVSEKYC